MGRRAPVRRRAYTLIELIVVVSIIMILVAILVPVVSNAREQAKTMLCAANMHEISALVNEFASMHDDRGPGENCTWVGPGPSYLVHGSHWYDLLNDEVLGRGKASSSVTTPYGVAGESANTDAALGNTTSLKALSCPNYLVYHKPLDGLPALNLPFSFNFDLTGGQNFSGAPAWGIYGIRCDPKQYPSTVYPYNDATHPGTYSLGPKYIRFGSNQILLCESDNTNFGLTSVGGRTTVGVTLGDSVASRPPYSGNNGCVSFRHPYYKKANFLHFDGHVDMLTPADDVYSVRMYNLGG